MYIDGRHVPLGRPTQHQRSIGMRAFYIHTNTDMSMAAGHGYEFRLGGDDGNGFHGCIQSLALYSYALPTSEVSHE